MSNAQVLTKGISIERAEASILKILRSTVYCSMATVAPLGLNPSVPKDVHTPYVNTAAFAFDGPYFLTFISAVKSQHIQNVLKLSTNSWSVFSTDQNPDGMKCGLQICGKTAPATAETLGRCLRRYGARFPHSYDGERTVDKMLSDAYRFYVFTPRYFKIFDEKEFGEETWVELINKEFPDV